jgi:solute carrier family 7 (L-type amino acid transporter), member 9/15
MHRGHTDNILNRYCLVGIAVMVAGILYWAGWRIILPKVFGYELVPRKETLADGTVITLVCHNRYDSRW